MKELSIATVATPTALVASLPSSGKQQVDNTLIIYFRPRELPSRSQWWPEGKGSNSGPAFIRYLLLPDGAVAGLKARHRARSTVTHHLRPAALINPKVCILMGRTCHRAD